MGMHRQALSLGFVLGWSTNPHINFEGAVLPAWCLCVKGGQANCPSQVGQLSLDEQHSLKNAWRLPQRTYFVRESHTN